jgi:hypothetical protein
MGITFFTIQKDLWGNRALMRLEDTRGIQTRITLHTIVDYIQLQKAIRPDTSTCQKVPLVHICVPLQLTLIYIMFTFVHVHITNKTQLCHSKVHYLCVCLGILQVET